MILRVLSLAVRIIFLHHLLLSPFNFIFLSQKVENNTSATSALSLLPTKGQKVPIRTYPHWVGIAFRPM